MKKAIIITTAIIIGIGTVAFTSPVKKSAALDINQVVDSLYDQLVTQKQSEASATLDNAYIDPEEIQKRLFAIDKEDTLYDGVALMDRGILYITTQKYIAAKGQDEHIEKTEYNFKLMNAYDIDEAEAVTNEIARQINEKAGKNASSQEKFYILCSYIGDNYEYDFDLKGKIEDFNDKNNNDSTASLDFIPFTKIVEEGHGKMVCFGFATLTYLTANKLGIDCKIVNGKDHAYNLVRFNSDSPYKICDLTAGRYPFIDEASYEAQKDMYDTTLSNSYSETQTIYTKETSSKVDIYPQIGYYLLHGYGLSPDREKALLIFMEYLLNPLVIAIIAITAIIFIISSTREAHRRHLRRLRRIERMKREEEGELK